ncbi:MAG: SNF2-related protein [Candidatus Xenobiia bacterium LiM19]
MLKNGEVLNNEFIVDTELKRGGMSVIYKGLQTSLKREVIIKVLSPGNIAVSQSELENLFNREANLLASIEHRQIPRVYSYFRHRSDFCIVMEYIQGVTLAEHIKKKRLPLPVDEVLDIGCEICEVLTFLHTRTPQIVFRDLKPENIIMQGGVPFLIDFGIAQIFDVRSTGKTQCFGTEGYASPEQYKGKTDYRSDIFSFGRLLWYLLSGQSPDTIPCYKPLESVARHNPRVPRELERMIIKCSDPDREKRYQTVMSIREDLDRLYQIKSHYLECRSCRSPVLEGHYLCSCCGALLPMKNTASKTSAITVKRKEEPLIEKMVLKNDAGTFSYGDAYYQAEFFGRTLGFDNLITIEHNRVDELPHQLKVVRKVLKTMRGRALLADEVGLGKTIEAGIIMEELRARGLIRKVLILVPSHLADQWRSEMQDKFELSFYSYNSNSGSPERLYRESSIIISIDTACRNQEVRECLEKQEWDMIIFDEAHYAKNRSTKRWKFVNSLKKQYILLLTATPLHNDLVELFNLITLLRPGHLKNEKDFVSKYVDSSDRRKPKNVDVLKTLLSEVMVRTRRASALVKFPQREAHTIRVKPSEKEQLLYREVTDFIRNLNTRGNSKHTFVLMILQQRLTSSPAAVGDSLGALKSSTTWKFSTGEQERLSYFITLAKGITRPSKSDRLLHLIRELKEKAVIFTDHVATQRYLTGFLKSHGLTCVLYRGTYQEKLFALRQFAEQAQVMIVSKAGNEGLNLHHYSRSLINYDLPWNPMRLEQRIGRLQRIGQTKTVQVFNLSLEDTIEDLILEILEKKVKLFELAIGQIDLILGLCFEDNRFDELIWKIIIEKDNEQDIRNALMSTVGNNLEQGGKKLSEIEECNIFLPDLDKDV